MNLTFAGLRIALPRSGWMLTRRTTVREIGGIGETVAGRRRVALNAVAVAIGLFLLFGGERAWPQVPSPGGGDVFEHTDRDSPQGGNTGSPSGTTRQSPWSDQYNSSSDDRDPQCGGLRSTRAQADRIYGAGIVIPHQKSLELYRAGRIVSCGECGKQGPDMVICWQKNPPPSDGAGLGKQPAAPNCPPLGDTAQKAAAAIAAGQNAMSALKRLDDAQHCLPPSAPRPIDCWDMMVDAQSKRAIDASYSARRASQALLCYEGNANSGGPKPPNAGDYVKGFLDGFAGCFGAVIIGPIIQIQTDAGIYAQFTQALLRGDSDRAADILRIKGDRDRTAFGLFVKSLNPQVIGANSEDAGRRDGSRLCMFGVIPGLMKAATKGTTTPTAALAEMSQALRAAVQQKAKEAVATISNTRRGPVLTGVLDSLTGKIYFGLNEGIPTDLHPLLRGRLDAYLKLSEGNTPVSAGIPGSHSEINALDRAFRAREQTPGLPPVTEQNLSEFLLHNRALRNPRITEYIPEPCKNCAAIIYGVNVVE